MGGEVADERGDLGVIRHDRTGVSRRAEVLAGVEARRRDAAERARAAGGDRTRPATGRHPRRRRGRASSAIGVMSSIGAVWPNRCTGAIDLGALGDRRLDRVGVDQEVLVVDVDEDRHGADARRRLGRGDERVRRHDDLVARPDADGAVGELERVGAVGDADDVLDADVVGVLALERVDLGTADECRGLELRAPHRQHLVEDLGLLRGEVEERHLIVLTCVDLQRAGGHARPRSARRARRRARRLPSRPSPPRRS